MGSYKNSVTVAVLRDGSGQYNVETNIEALEKSYDWSDESQKLTWSEDNLSLRIYDVSAHTYLTPGTEFNPIITAYYEDGTNLNNITNAIDKIDGQKDYTQIDNNVTVTVVSETQVTATLTRNISGLVSVINLTGGISSTIDLSRCTYSNNVLTIDTTELTVTTIKVEYKYLDWIHLSDVWQTINSNNYIFDFSVFTDYLAYRCKEHPDADPDNDPEMIVFNKLMNNILGTNMNLGFTLYQESTQIDKMGLVVIPVTFNLNPEYAKFALNAKNIEASIADKALTFDKNGLHVKNAGLDINSEYTEWRIQETCDASQVETNIQIITIYDIIALRNVKIEGGSEISLDNCILSTENYKLVTITNTTFVSGMKIEVLYAYGDHTSQQKPNEFSSTSTEKLFYYNTDRKELYVKGNITATSGSFTGEVYASTGIFNGTVYATDGTFSGSIQSNSGSIGGITINSEGLVSTGFQIKSDGSITANTISLGNGATIQDFLQLGNDNDVKILNPDATGNNGLILQAKQTTLDKNGILSLGNLTLNGFNSTIYGENWSISNDKAIFQNATIRGKIETSVFETGSVQTVGGQMIFRPSYKVNSKTEISQIDDNIQVTPISGTSFVTATLTYNISSLVSVINITEGSNIPIDLSKCTYNNNILTIDTTDNTTQLTITTIKVEYKYGTIGLTIDKTETITTNNYIYLIGYHSGMNDSIKPTSVETNDITTLTFSNLTGNIENITGIIDFGQNDTFNYIGINGSDEVSSAMPPISLVMDSVTHQINNSTVINHNLFLGNFETNQDLNLGLTGYGLYADNVYLKGAIVTESAESSEGRYAGINTRSNITRIENDDNSTIVFWAGSSDLTDEKIKAAPFQVTKDGSMYAKNGIFEGSVIADSVISKTDITTDKITGDGDSSTTGYALNFLNANEGIGFYNSANPSSPSLIFAINNNGFANVNDNSDSIYFINFNNGVSFLGDEYITSALNSETPQLKMKNNTIKAFKKDINSPDENYGSLEFTPSEINLKHDANLIMKLKSNLITSKENFQIDKKMLLGEKMEYRLRDDNGYYDLYITGA